MTIVHRRTPRADKRIINNALTVQSAAEALGKITRGCEIYALCTGQFSLVDVIQHALKATGAARLVVSTWTAAAADVEIAYRLLTDGAIESMRFVVDFSFPARQPAYCQALRERFGDAAIVVTKNHAKFVLVCNRRWSVVIRMSMNLNLNRRLENIELSDDKQMAEFLESVVDGLFAAEPAGASLDRRPIENIKHFQEHFGLDAPAAESVTSTDEAKFFGEGPWSNDLRRPGLSWE
jgi:hypothetical protein